MPYLHVFVLKGAFLINVKSAAVSPRWMREENSMSNRDNDFEGRDAYDMDIDRMINEGLGGGQVSGQNGLIEESTVDTMTGASDAEQARDDR